MLLLVQLLLHLLWLLLLLMQLLLPLRMLLLLLVHLLQLLLLLDLLLLLLLLDLLLLLGLLGLLLPQRLHLAPLLLVGLHRRGPLLDGLLRTQVGRRSLPVPQTLSADTWRQHTQSPDRTADSRHSYSPPVAHRHIQTQHGCSYYTESNTHQITVTARRK